MGRLRKWVDLTLAVCQTALAVGVHAKLLMATTPLAATVEADVAVDPDQEFGDDPGILFPRVLVARDEATVSATVTAAHEIAGERRPELESRVGGRQLFSLSRTPDSP